EGDDTLRGGLGEDVLVGDLGNDNLYGGEGNDHLHGGYGNDRLRGEGGADRMLGGPGDDIYYVDDVADIVIETAGWGTDTVYTSVSYNLGTHNHVESLRTVDETGSEAINLTGSSIVNFIRGNAGDNVIDGGGGIDQLYGYGGNDTFVFSN